jgi:cobalt/nickel transport system permease protein
MVCDTYFSGDSMVHRLDPRVRIVVAAAFAGVMAASTSMAVCVAGFLCATLLVIVARLPWRPLAKRMAVVNVFMLTLWIMLPLVTDGPAALELGPLAWSRTGLERAAAITLRGNAIVLVFTALMSTIETVNLAHALRHLRVPAKLVHLLMLTVRYVDLLHHEYTRLRQAMKVRCFRPGMNAHTYRSTGHLVGMLLVNSCDRAQRVVAAMKCRGFRGEFYAFDHFVFARRDAIFVAASMTLLATLVGLHWL